MSEAAEERLFRVWARHEDARHGRLMREPSPEEAAIAYVEHLPLEAGLHELGIVVHDVLGGHDHSFRIVLDADEPPAVA